jgi:carbonic anhydrase/acetyltransferase-like protein (isoleucine patch superfamily)
MMMPTHEKRVVRDVGSDTKLIGDVLWHVHRCSIGDGAAICRVSISLNRCSIKSMSLIDGAASVPAGKATSFTHCTERGNGERVFRVSIALSLNSRDRYGPPTGDTVKRQGYL